MQVAYQLVAGEDAATKDILERCVVLMNPAHNPDGHGTTVWNIFEATSNYFSPSGAQFMVNYRVDKLRPLIDALRAEGCQVDDKVDESEYGKFGWVVDPDGNKIELWEPPAEDA